MNYSICSSLFLHLLLLILYIRIQNIVLWWVPFRLVTLASIHDIIVTMSEWPWKSPLHYQRPFGSALRGSPRVLLGGLWEWYITHGLSLWILLIALIHKKKQYFLYEAFTKKKFWKFFNNFNHSKGIWMMTNVCPFYDLIPRVFKWIQLRSTHFQPQASNNLSSAVREESLYQGNINQGCTAFCVLYKSRLSSTFHRNKTLYSMCVLVMLPRLQP